MKKTVMTVVALACAALVCSCGGKKNITEGDHAKLDSLSYCLGTNIGGGLKQQFRDIAIDEDVCAKGIVDGITGKAKKDHKETLALLREFFGETLQDRLAAHQEAMKNDSTVVFNAFVDKAECDKISYAIGSDLGKNVADSKLTLQYYWLVEGFKEAWNGNMRLSDEQVMVYLNHYFMQVLPAENAKRSAEWLEKKKKGTGVKVTESGLVYKVVKEGDMTKAAKRDEDVVKVHYIGKLQDGTVFDASRFENWPKERQEMVREQQPTLFDEKGKYTKNDPIEFPLNRVIKGWTEGMKLVGPGGKIKLYIPAELAYGRRGAGNMIGANEALEFEVELIDVTPAPEPEVKPEVEAKEEKKAEAPKAAKKVVAKKQLKK